MTHDPPLPDDTDPVSHPSATHPPAPTSAPDVPAAELELEVEPGDAAAAATPDPRAAGTADAVTPPTRAEPSPAETAARLAEAFPALFGAGVVKPIKLRIQADIQQRAPGAFGKRALSVFLHRHTTSTPYLRALLGTKTRYDLDGAEAGPVADEHLAAAEAELARRRAIVEARREAGRAAARAARGMTPARAGSGGPPGAARGARQPHPREPEDVRPAHTGAQGARHDSAAGQPGPPGPPGQPKGQARPPREGRPGRGPMNGPVQGTGAGPRPPRAAGDAAGGRGAREQATVAHVGPVDPARRERLALLRAYEQTTLSRANFCALKRITEAELDAALAAEKALRDAAKAGR